LPIKTYSRQDREGLHCKQQSVGMKVQHVLHVQEQHSFRFAVIVSVYCN